MTRTIEGLTDSIAVDLSMLSTVYPLVNPAAERGGYDFRTNTARIVLSDDAGSRGRDELICELRPLLFGVAWRVLDLLIEYGLSHVQTGEWRIAAKRRRAAEAQVSPLTSDPVIWSRIAATYAGTAEQRHSLVHRSFVMSASGAMTRMAARSGDVVRDLSVAEQDAMCRLAQRAARIALSQRCSARERLDLVASLDALTAHHGQSAIGGGATETLPLRLEIDADRIGDGRWSVNTLHAWETANSVLPGRPYFDLLIFFPDSGLAPLVGRLDDAPRDSSVELDPTHLPDWVDA